MDGARDQFLAAAGFAADQHGRRGRRHQADLSQDIFHRRAVADDLVVVKRGIDLFLQVGVFQFQPVFQGLDLVQRRQQAFFVFFLL